MGLWENSYYGVDSLGNLKNLLKVKKSPSPISSASSWAVY